MLRHKVFELKFRSGLKGLVIDTPKTGVVVAEVGFRAGEFMLKKEKWETAHLMEHVLLGANKNFAKARDFQASIEQNGAYSNASTSLYDITYEVESAHFEWQRVVGLMLDGISTPKFLQEEFDAEAGSVREELISRSNNHFRHLNAALRQSMGLASLTDQERVELMSGVSRQDLVKHYKKTHTTSNARFIIAGNFNGDYTEVRKLFKDHLLLEKGEGRIALPDEKASSIDEPLVLRKPSVPNVYLYLDLYLGRELSPKERASMRILCTMLTETMYSRVFGAAREKGWVYGMGSGMSYSRDLSSWWLGAQVSKTNCPSLVRLIRDELLRLKAGIIDEEDFISSQKHLLGKTMRSGQTATGLVSRYSKFYADDNSDSLSRLPKILESVKKEDCIKLFRELLQEKTWGLGVLGSTSLVPARNLKDYLQEVFDQE